MMLPGGASLFLMFAVTAAHGNDLGYVQCPDGALCPDRTTCCINVHGHYGCCPYAFAVCCSDNVHCCPEGYRCNLSNGTCLRVIKATAPVETLLTPMTVNQQLQSLDELGGSSTRCPDGGSCGDYQTCCLGKSGKYGCCPLPNAVCCSDHESCCPEGYTCKVSTQQCTLGNHTVAMVKKLRAIQNDVPELQSAVGTTRCPDGGSCGDYQTCCLGKSGKYGCCPMPHAVCCSDHESCCPEGFKCKVSTRQCTFGNQTVAMVKKLRAIPNGVSELQTRVGSTRCPDGATCGDYQTCCLGKSGNYGCCPIPNAVCCSDHETCCPEGFTCMVSTQQCVRGHLIISAVKKLRARPSIAVVQHENVINQQCPDGGSCDDDQTCCQLQDKSYGCCPYSNAVCCQDQLHCCPESTTCDTQHAQCLHGNHSTPALLKLKALRLATSQPTSSINQLCPDGGVCGDDQTCCQLPDKSYGCCPYPNAVCCQDKVHCCPESTKCDTQHALCLYANHSTPALLKLKPHRHTASPTASSSNQQCPDGGECDVDQTCCLLPDQSYGCCPYPSAVCCDDLVHCCPESATCDTQHSRCLHGNGTSPALLKLKARRRTAPTTSQISNQYCPDGAECDDDQTCCQMVDGSYGCCPYKQAVCCPDRVHCCPGGYTCDATKQQCINDTNVMPMLRRLSPRRTSAPPQPQLRPDQNASGNSILCPNKKDRCPDDKKCCLRYDTVTYFCCPYGDGVCCSDGTFCCKPGFRCFVPTQSCIPLDSNVGLERVHFEADQRLHEPQRITNTTTHGNSVCPDGHVCPADSTCCQSKSGKFKCCPFASGVCCADGVHCCPENYVCNQEQQRCDLPPFLLDEVPMLEKMPSTPRPLQ